jgi:hypothetical protein
MAAALIAAGLSAPVLAYDSNWTFIARDQAGVVVELARHSVASSGDLSAAVFRFRPAQGDAAARSYAIAANCVAGTFHVAPADAIASDTQAWLKSDARHAAFRHPASRSVGAQILAALCNADSPAPYGSSGITLSMEPPARTTNGVPQN